MRREKWRWITAWVALGGLFALAIGAAVTRAQMRRPLGFQSGDWVLIAAFENKTGEKLFDGTVEYALQRELEQSRTINVAPRPRINDVLELMRRKTDAVLDEDTARQVAIRDGGIRGLLTGRVDKFGDRYLVTVRLIDPVSGKTAAVFEKQGGQDQILGEVHSVADAIRGKLGETPPAGAEHLEKATTTSLAALRAFSAGMAAINNYQWASGAALFEEATREDPQFASAHIYAAHSYKNQAEGAKAAPHFEAALRLAPGVSERERLFILGSFYQRYTRDLKSARQQYEALVDLYPDDFWGVNNLAFLCLELGDLDCRTRALERVAALRPNLVDPLSELLIIYKYVRPDSAKAGRLRESLLRLRAGGGLGSWFAFDLDDAPLSSWRAGDLVAAERATAQLGSRTNERVDWFQLALADLLLGKLKAAEKACVASGDEFRTQDHCLIMVAFERGDQKGVREYARRVIEDQKKTGFYVEGDLPGVMAARMGLLPEAQQLTKGLAADGANTSEGAILLARRKIPEAIKKLQAHDSPNRVFIDLDFFLNRDLLAEALAKQDKIDDAISVLEDLTPAKVQSMDVFPWLHCRAQLARLLRQRSRIDEALKVEDQLRHYLSAADSDNPLVNELAHLQESRNN